MSRLANFFTTKWKKLSAPSPVQRLAALTEAVRHVDILHISLGGITAIVAVLLLGLGLPPFVGMAITSRASFLAITIATFVGIGRLYFLNYNVHKLLSEHARLTEVLVNSLGQGFLSFGADGVCEGVYSEACRDLLSTDPAGQNIADVLRISDEARADFKEWMDVLFTPDHALSFPDVVNFFPRSFSHPEGRRIELDYKPVYDRPGVLVRVILIATDRTEEREAQQLAEERQNYANMIFRIFRERNQFLATLRHLRKFLEESAVPVHYSDAAPLLRMLHTLKAAVNHFHLSDLGKTIHALETNLRSAGEISDTAFMDAIAAGRQQIQADLAETLESIKDMIGRDYESRGNIREIEESALYNFALLMKVSDVRGDIVEHYLQNIVAMPVQECLLQFERELADLAEFTGKQLKPIQYSGSNPPVLLHDFGPLFFALSHISRNILDHGIEPAVTRIARGKDPVGQVSIYTDLLPNTEKDVPWLLISIADDGGGIDPELVRRQLSIMHAPGAWKNLSDHEVIQKIFSWGFSTREKVSELSGRGVGLEVIDREVRLLGGSIEVFSEIHKGARFEIKLPYRIQI